MEKALDLIGIGECLVEFVELGDGTYQQSFAGDVLNSLSMANVLRLRTGLVSALGRDPFLQKLQELLQSQNTDTSHAPAIDGYNGVYYVMRRPDGSRYFHFLRKDSAATFTLQTQAIAEIESYLRTSKAVLLSSIPLAVMKDSWQLMEMLARLKGSTRIYFDLNVRPALWASIDTLRSLIPTLAKFVDVLFVTNDDDRALFRDRAMSETMRYFREVGFPAVVGRRGDQSTVVLSKNEELSIPIVQGINVIDPTGAGDAFNAGFIAAELAGQSLEQATLRGNACAATVIEHIGGLSTPEHKPRIEALYERIRSNVNA